MAEYGHIPPFPGSLVARMSLSRRGNKVPLGRKALGPALMLESIGLKFRVVAQLVSKFYDVVLFKHELSITDHAVLLALSTWRGAKAPTVAHFASRLGEERTVVGKRLASLDEREFVTVGPSHSKRGSVAKADARLRVIELTPKGKRVVRASLERFRRAQRDLRDILTLPVLAMVYEALVTLEREVPARTAAWAASGKGLPLAIRNGDQKTVASGDASQRYRPLQPSRANARQGRTLSHGSNSAKRSPK